VTYAGTPLQIGFNARYLMDVLTAVDVPQMDVELCDELSPGVLKPTGQAAGVATRYTAVIMPMRI
jgi:DNA polymerase-3 subunit beta